MNARPPSRVIIEGVEPEIDGGRFPIKRTAGEEVVVEADIHADGHDRLGAALRHRPAGADGWSEVRMTELGNDRWAASFRAPEIGRHEYTLVAWVDRFGSWRAELQKKHEAGQRIESELLEGADLVRRAAERAAGEESEWLRSQAEVIAAGDLPMRLQAALDVRLAAQMERHAAREDESEYGRVLIVVVERERARVGAWYEMFPRSAADGPEPASFREAEARLPEVAAMGFDVLYLPPIHPIGRSFRKGPDNTLRAGPGDPGSPWAIGAAEGGHTAVHPELGSLEDFDHFAAEAARHGLEIALDLAFQCSPDHPWVREHPDWFRKRPDGTIKYAENPPKKYQDIYPLDFACRDWRALWTELCDVVLFWCARGVRIFRVDNPHTKPFRFWEWLIDEVRHRHPDAIFLSEAFTRPKVMRYLAKSGFSQSYTYFTWRNTKEEVIAYFTELTQTAAREYMRPNLFANTPDILPEYLQVGGRPAFQVRLVLAATLGATYGIYGPAFELCEAQAHPGTEEYEHSEKYEVRRWDRDRPGNLRHYIARLNEIRRQNPALHQDRNLRFYPADNRYLLFYGKATADRSNAVLVVINLDPFHPQSGWLHVPTAEIGLGPGSYQVHDLISDARYLWQGAENYVSLDPAVSPAHVFRVRRRVRTEHDFDYFL